jgi:pyrroline-5-carboxylate reductase
MAKHNTANPAGEPILEAGASLGVIGAGVMGRALVQGILRAGLLTREQIWAATRSTASAQAVERELGIPVMTQYAGRLPQTRILLLCVKPAHMEAVLHRLAQGGLAPETLLISIAAGLPTQRLEELLGTENPWIRAMPNTPSVVGESMTVICGGKNATPEQLERAQALFAAVGQCRQVDEQHFNAITALSGSGPAYIYLIIEAMADAGVRVGLPRKLALELVTQTVVGAARMVQTTGRHPASLRDDVTTPAGCTIAGLLMLEDGKIRSVLARAIEEAARIAQGLGQTRKA